MHIKIEFGYCLIINSTYLSHQCETSATKLKLFNNDEVVLGNKRGMVILHAESFEGLQQGVIIVEGIWPSEAFIGNEGINTLVGSDPVPPNGGAAFHDTAVWIMSHNKII